MDRILYFSKNVSIANMNKFIIKRLLEYAATQKILREGLFEFEDRIELFLDWHKQERC